MKYMKTKLGFILIILVLAIACKKNHDGNGGSSSDQPTAEELIMDSVYLFSKEVYFWNDVIPAYGQFNPRQYKGNTELQSATNVM